MKILHVISKPDRASLQKPYKYFVSFTVKAAVLMRVFTVQPQWLLRLIPWVPHAQWLHSSPLPSPVPGQPPSSLHWLLPPIICTLNFPYLLVFSQLSLLQYGLLRSSCFILSFFLSLKSSCTILFKLQVHNIVNHNFFYFLFFYFFLLVGG